MYTYKQLQTYVYISAHKNANSSHLHFTHFSHFHTLTDWYPIECTFVFEHKCSSAVIWKQVSWNIYISLITYTYIPIFKAGKIPIWNVRDPEQVWDNNYSEF